VINKFLSVVILIFLHCSANGQTTYSNLYKLGFGNDNLIKSFIEISDTIYVSTGDICYSTGSSCSTLSSFNKNGELIKSLNNEFLQAGNENNIELLDDKFVVSCHPSHPNRLSSDFIFFDKNLSDSEAYTTFADSSYRYFNEGIIFHQENYYTYGNGGIVANDSIIGYIIKWDERLESHKKVLIYNELDQENMIDDLQINSQGNLVYINQGESSTINKDVSLFTTIDTAGKILNRFEFSKSQNENHRNFVLTNNDDYVYVASFPNVWTESLLCFDSEDFSEKWVLEMPFQQLDETYRSYDIYDLSRANNGDILGCGEVFMPVADLGKYHTGFIFRLDAITGELLWIRYYLVPNKINQSEGELFHDSFLRVIKELDNGDIQVAGRVEQDDGSLERKLWLLRTDANGCLDNNCGEENIISNTEDFNYNNSVVNIYPNPSNGIVHIESEKTIQHIMVIDIIGRIIEVHLNNKINLFHLNSGFYTITLQMKDGTITSKKLHLF